MKVYWKLTSFVDFYRISSSSFRELCTLSDSSVVFRWLYFKFTLDCFMALPNSFFAPKAPEKFQEFISRFGTHYTSAAKFGGQLTITKTKKMIAGMSIEDTKKEVQAWGFISTFNEMRVRGLSFCYSKK